MIPKSRNPRIKAPTQTLTPFLAPGMVRGFKSFPEASSLTPDFAALLGNTRLGNQGIQARNGNVSVSTSLSGIVRGVYSCSFDGTSTIFAATWDGSTKVSIYKSTDDGATWTNISPTSGRYGDTRLTGSASSGPVYFSLVNDVDITGTSWDMLIIENGHDTPRIYGYNEAAPITLTMSLASQPPSVPNTSNLFQQTGFAHPFNVKGFGTQTFSNTGATPLVLANGSGQAITLTVPASVTLNSTAKVVFSSSVDFSTATQFVIICDQQNAFTVQSYSGSTAKFSGTPFTTGALNGSKVYVSAGTGAGQYLNVVANDTNSLTFSPAPSVNLDNTSVIQLAQDPLLFYQKLKVELYDGTNYQTCFDPSTHTGSILALTYPDTVSDSGLQIAYPMPTGSPLTLSAITGVRFTYVSSNGVATQAQIYLMAAGGQTQGGASFGVAYHSSGSHQTGPGTIITNKGPQPLSQLNAGSNYGNLYIIDDQRFYFDYLVSADIPLSSISSGIDTLLVYRQDVGQTGYYYAAFGLFATYSAGNWILWNANTTTVTIGLDGNAGPVGGDSLGNLVNFSKPFPDAGNVCLPIGTTSIWINGRCFVCSGSTLWISEYGQPFLFTLAQRFISPGQPDPLSGTTILKSGETLQQIVAIGATPTSSSSLGGPLDGTGTVYFWTDANFYKIMGFSAQGLDQTSLVGTHGTLSPNSVARNRTGIYWLDNYGQVCYYTAGTSMIYGVSIPDQQINVISLYKVDNEIPYIPGNTGSSPYNRKQFAMGVCNNNRYYLAYTKSGGTANVEALVFCEQLGTFDSLDDFAYNGTTYSAEFMLPYYSASAGRVKTLYFSPASTTTNVLEHEVPGNTNTVNFKFTTRQIFDNFANLVEIDTVTVGISSDNAAGFALTVDRYYITQLGQTTRTSTLNFLSQGGTPSYQVLTDAPIGDTGITAQLSIYGLVPGSTTFLSLNAVVERTKTTGYVRSA